MSGEQATVPGTRFWQCSCCEKASNLFMSMPPPRRADLVALLSGDKIVVSCMHCGSPHHLSIHCYLFPSTASETIVYASEPLTKDK